MNKPADNIPVNLDRIKINFFKKVDTNGPIPKHNPELGACWIWMGYVNPTGYACMKVEALHEQRANRVSWRIHFGDIPDGIYCLHKCDNRQCTNPAHLYLGNQTQNMQDMFARNRKDNIGIHNPRARLNENDVKNIRVMLSDGVSDRIIAIRYGVREGTIGFIRRGETWKHI